VVVAAAVVWVSGDCSSGCDGDLGFRLWRLRRRLGFLGAAAAAAETWVSGCCCGLGFRGLRLASRQCQIRPQECCGAVALYGGEKTVVTYKYQKRFLRRSVPISVKVNGLVTIWWLKRQLPINVKNGV
jgi:hypothetical protein